MYNDLKVHNFLDSKKAGDVGEEFFKFLFPEITRLDGTKSDFVHRETGITFELKTENYDHNKTPNVFIERISNSNKGSLGGPWQALTNGTTYYMHLFIKSGMLIMFETKELVDRLNDLMAREIYKERDLVSIDNGVYKTLGFKVNRASLRKLSSYRELDFKNHMTKPVA